MHCRTGGGIRTGGGGHCETKRYWPSEQHSLLKRPILETILDFIFEKRINFADAYISKNSRGVCGVCSVCVAIKHVNYLKEDNIHLSVDWAAIN